MTRAQAVSYNYYLANYLAHSRNPINNYSINEQRGITVPEPGSRRKPTLTKPWNNWQSQYAYIWSGDLMEISVIYII